MSGERPAALAGAPRDGAPPPPAVARLAGDDTALEVWRNEAGGRTFRLGAGTGRDRHVKWLPASSAASGEPSPAEEARRLEWAGRYTRVPRVRAHGSDADGSWLVTESIPALGAVDPHWLARPERAVAALGAGLRALHEALPVEACPFSWAVADRLGALARRPDGGRALAILPPTPEVDVAVVCHGDACAPNTLLDERGRALAHVDLGELGVADRWADLAVAALSLGWNYGPGHERRFFDAYGVRPDEDRLAYYRALWNA